MTLNAGDRERLFVPITNSDGTYTIPTEWVTPHHTDRAMYDLNVQIKHDDTIAYRFIVMQAATRWKYEDTIADMLIQIQKHKVRLNLQAKAFLVSKIRTVKIVYTHLQGGVIGDNSWRRLAVIGWEVNWFSNQNQPWIKHGRAGGALASQASRRCPSKAHAEEEFERCTGRNLSDGLVRELK